jgi:hypothetical protein
MVEKAIPGLEKTFFSYCVLVHQSQLWLDLYEIAEPLHCCDRLPTAIDWV